MNHRKIIIQEPQRFLPLFRKWAIRRWIVRRLRVKASHLPMQCRLVAHIKNEIGDYGAHFAPFRHTDYFVPSFTLKSS
jgi:hypothetical protein